MLLMLTFSTCASCIITLTVNHETMMKVCMFVTYEFEHGEISLHEHGSGRRRKANVIILTGQTSCAPVSRVFKVRVPNPAQYSPVATEHVYCNKTRSLCCRNQPSMSTAMSHWEVFYRKWPGRKLSMANFPVWHGLKINCMTPWRSAS